MTDKTATGRLREGLTERGVEWKATVSPIGCVFTHWDSPVLGGMRIHARDNEDGTLAVFDGCGLTPEQAIAATVGAGTCRLDGYTDAKFSVCQSPDETDFVDYAEVCECTSCGASVIVPHEYERISHDRDELWPKYNFCPICGRRVEVNS